MSGEDLAAAVKFVHFKGLIKGWSAYNTKSKRVAFLASLVPVWTERVLCAAPAVAPVAAAATAAPPRRRRRLLLLSCPLLLLWTFRR